MLTDTAVRHAKPGTKALRLFDSGGLYLEVSPSGGNGGKEKRISRGVYPDVSLKDAKSAATKPTGSMIDMDVHPASPCPTRRRQ